MSSGEFGKRWRAELRYEVQTTIPERSSRIERACSLSQSVRARPLFMWRNEAYQTWKMGRSPTVPKLYNKFDIWLRIGFLVSSYRVSR
jgi:hypothetical protein